MTAVASATVAVSATTTMTTDGGGSNPVGPGVGQGGAQDFGQFRAILEDGGIPGPETLDDVGFFNEHKIELPAPDCGDDVCIHGALAQMGNLMTGADCMMVMIGMNTPIDPGGDRAAAAQPRGCRRHQRLDEGRADRARSRGPVPDGGRAASRRSRDAGDLQRRCGRRGRSCPAETRRRSRSPSPGCEAEGQTNIYEGLWTAYEAVEHQRDPGAAEPGAAALGRRGHDRNHQRRQDRQPRVGTVGGGHCALDDRPRRQLRSRS